MAEETHPAIAVGDFNQSIYSTGFQRMLRESNLHIAPFPVGFLPTWPCLFVLPFMQVPIDLAVANEKLAITQRKRINIPGSDHMAVSNRIMW